MHEDTVLSGTLLQGLSIGIGADGSHIGSGAGGLDHPLGDTDGILGGSTGNVLHGKILHQVGVDAHVLLLGQDGVVEGDIVLGEELSGDITRDIEEGVAHGKDSALRDRHGVEKVWSAKSILQLNL